MDKIQEQKAKNQLILSMIIFSTIGIFVKFIPLPSGVIATFRGLIGGIFLYILLKIKNEKININLVKNNIKWLLLSGFLIGLNWILLFEGYNNSTVSIVTLFYYLCPIFLIVLSIIFYKEKITKKKIYCILIALIGMILVSGILKGGLNNISQIKGIIYGSLAGLCYAFVVLLNKKLYKLNSYDKTIIQLLVAGSIVLPYGLLELSIVNKNNIEVNIMVIILLIFVGIVHTGLAYSIYFNSLKDLRAQTIAILSYLDPVIAIFLSTVILREKLGIFEIVGAILILGSSYISEKGE